jgi:hypothetical protein
MKMMMNHLSLAMVIALFRPFPAPSLFFSVPVPVISLTTEICMSPIGFGRETIK